MDDVTHSSCKIRTITLSLNVWVSCLYHRRWLRRSTGNLITILTNFGGDIRHFVHGWSNIAGDASPAALTPMSATRIRFQSTGYLHRHRQHLQAPTLAVMRDVAVTDGGATSNVTYWSECVVFFDKFSVPVIIPRTARRETSIIRVYSLPRHSETDVCSHFVWSSVRMWEHLFIYLLLNRTQGTKRYKQRLNLTQHQ